MTSKAVIAVLVVSAATVLTGCIAVPIGDPYPQQYGGRAHDRDRDGIPNRADRDRDGDGVRNRQDSRPNDPRRY